MRKVTTMVKQWTHDELCIHCNGRGPHKPIQVKAMGGYRVDCRHCQKFIKFVSSRVYYLTEQKIAKQRVLAELRELNTGERVRLTREMIQAGLLNNMWFYSDRQKELLGTDGRKGWMKATTDKLILKRHYDEFLEIARESIKSGSYAKAKNRSRTGDGPYYSHKPMTLDWIKG